MTDRFVLDGKKFARWLGEAFGIWDRKTALRRLGEVDTLAERVVVDGKDYLIPDRCYVKLVETRED